jgi:1,4-dihydroxy-2-naphthoate octaprenyltransferase
MSKRREIWTRKLLYPGHTLPTAAAPVILAVALAWHDHVFAPVPALLALVAGWLIQFAGVVTDNLENLRREPEDRVDDIRDRDLDAVKGKNTIAIRLGPRWSRAEFVGLLVASYAMPFWFWMGLGFGPPVLLPLVTLPLAVALAHRVCTRDRFIDLVPMTPRAAQLLRGYSALLAVGVALSRA